MFHVIINYTIHEHIYIFRYLKLYYEYRDLISIYTEWKMKHIHDFFHTT